MDHILKLRGCHCHHALNCLVSKSSFDLEASVGNGVSLFCRCLGQFEEVRDLGLGIVYVRLGLGIVKLR